MSGTVQRDVQTLLQAAANGDTEAWGALVDLYSGSVWRVIERHNLSGADAGDVGQAVWLKFLEHIDLFVKRPEDVDRWLTTTTRLECVRRTEEIAALRFRKLIQFNKKLRDPRVQYWIRSVCRHAVSPQRLTDLAAFLAGPRRTSLLDEWRSHLSGETGCGLARKDQIRAARGFLLAAVRYRLQDAGSLAWRPADAVLGSRTLSNLFVWAPVIAMLVAIVHHDGRFGLVSDVQDPAALGAFLYGVIRTGRWWRGVKPPEPKARRARE